MRAEARSRPDPARRSSGFSRASEYCCHTRKTGTTHTGLRARRKETSAASSRSDNPRTRLHPASHCPFRKERSPRLSICAAACGIRTRGSAGRRLLRARRPRRSRTSDQTRSFCPSRDATEHRTGFHLPGAASSSPSRSLVCRPFERIRSFPSHRRTALRRHLLNQRGNRRHHHR